jgi:hypothetical protein
MSIILDRIHSLGLTESDCAPMTRQQLEELLLRVKPLLARGSNGFDAEVFSIAELTPEAIIAKLKSIAVCDQVVLVCWPSFREGFNIKWEVFVAFLNEFWCPSSDDVIVTTPTLSWILEITHEELVRFKQFDKGKSQR